MPPEGVGLRFKTCLEENRPADVDRDRGRATSGQETTTMRTNRLARTATTSARLLLGLVFFVCGLDGFLHFLPQPSGVPPENALLLAVAFMKSGYLFPLIKGTEVLVGLSLLSNRLVPLALVVLAPVLLNIVAFHAFLAPEGLLLAVVLLALALLLAWSHRAAYGPLLSLRGSRLDAVHA
jgi:uncharacterized membrane protein YphA (DoxX/SURF4 family)